MSSQGVGSRAVRKRRRKVAGGLTKASFQLATTVVQAVDSLVREGGFASKNVFVEEALRDKIRDMGRQALYAAYAEAASDPVFMAEFEATNAAFDVTTSDGLAKA